MNAVFNNALQAIGNTPLVALDRLFSGPGKLHAGMEFLLKIDLNIDTP